MVVFTLYLGYTFHDILELQILFHAHLFHLFRYCMCNTGRTGSVIARIAGNSIPVAGLIRIRTEFEKNARLAYKQ